MGTRRRRKGQQRAKGEKVGAGASAEVFLWGADRILKLFREPYQYAVDLEAERARAVHACGVPSPEVFETVEVDGRRGIVYERVEGSTLMSHLGERGIASVAGALAEIHVAIHKIKPVGLPTLRELVDDATELDAETREAMLARIGQMPAGEVVCHGDLHPGNIVIGPAGPLILDWVNATAAPAGADVARSLMLIRYQGMTETTPADVQESRSEMAAAYLAAYLEISSVTREDVALCEPTMAHALLRAEPDNLHREALERLI